MTHLKVCSESIIGTVHFQEMGIDHRFHSPGVKQQTDPHWTATKLKLRSLVPRHGGSVQAVAYQKCWDM